MKLMFDKDRVVSTRIGADPRDAKVQEFAIDFAGPKLKQFTESEQAAGHHELQRERGHFVTARFITIPSTRAGASCLSWNPHNQGPG